MLASINTSIMSLFPNQTAPDFQTKDISGNIVQLSAFKGRKVLLTFYRHVGCPFSNLRFLELQQMDQYFKDMGLVVLAVYESSSANLNRYCADESYYARVVANPEFDLYTLYDIELSALKTLFSMYKGAHAKIQEGRKKFKVQFEQEGHTDLLGGDFLIDEAGIVRYPYYNQYLGDHLPVNDIVRFINNKPLEMLAVSCKV